jgi:protein tyrosine phosphatase (PTP) superfamily phosphohydrolase (DUF442 family)
MIDLFRRLSLIALLAVLCAGAQPQQHDDSPGYDPEPLADIGPVKGVGGFTEVTPHLYRGGQPSQKGLESLAKMGIDIVVDGRLTGDKKEGKAVTKLGMQFVPIPWHCLYPRDEVFARFLALVRDNPDKKIFVHCRYGDDRTGMMIAAYRMAMQGWTWQQARKEMDEFGFHHKVCASLLLYEKEFPERLKKAAFQGLGSSPDRSNSESAKPGDGNPRPVNAEPRSSEPGGSEPGSSEPENPEPKNAAPASPEPGSPPPANPPPPPSAAPPTY